ncbi:hypothetical protein CI109_100823 [Kwoniella shandongensis]|uniref:Mediator of RNA polymerase II transcription subunit 21 n=1 Tax=Kwoniella shandongensis TaxID=1734106 RepID=A0A5M6BPD7_9TREE|nr:uncharacterized protein CI109_006912 [Kwoniella shandongensis]KAA5524758.1 hypothetical protein CI109_006912 [Kwoniella shandongensis]
MLNAELSTDMDRITQLQDAILDLLTITSTSIDYITKKTNFEQISKAIPTTLQAANGPSRAEYKATIETFVADIIRRSKDIETLAKALPKKDESSIRAQRLAELQDEMKIANQEYKAALAQSEELLGELQAALDQALEEPVNIETTKYVNKTGQDNDAEQQDVL